MHTGSVTGWWRPPATCDGCGSAAYDRHPALRTRKVCAKCDYLLTAGPITVTYTPPSPARSYPSVNSIITLAGSLAFIIMTCLEIAWHT